ncbi:MAG: hypothetical protein RL011_669 [Pseudomonadota bacterium]|jgi:tRNA U34 5-methylaminomethyl-2-thiouridine-forming methyltransferase MnmC
MMFPTETPSERVHSDLGMVVATADGSYTLSHHEHGECYHTRAGALAEAHHLYVVASGVLEIWSREPKQAVSVLDVGLGLGYTALATLEAWAKAPHAGELALVSLEINPDLVPALASGAAPWQDNWPAERLEFCRKLVQVDEVTWTSVSCHPTTGAIATWVIRIGDASNQAIPKSPILDGYSHVWQDPFSPGKNPIMWQAQWFERLREVVLPQCVMMTYSVAVPVRAALDASVWSWEKIPATMPGKRKRHWLKAWPKNTSPS